MAEVKVIAHYAQGYGAGIRSTGLNLSQSVQESKKHDILSIGQLSDFRNKNLDPDAFPARSSQWVSLVPNGATFRSANRENSGKYNVSTDRQTGEIYVAELPKLIVNQYKQEIDVLNAGNIAISILLKDIQGIDYNPGKKEYTLISHLSKWFVLDLPPWLPDFKMLLDGEGVLRGFAKGDEKRLNYSPYQENWNGLLAVRDEYFIDASLPPSARFGLLGCEKGV